MTVQDPLMSTLHFTLDELRQNRAGRMSKRQQQRVLRTSRVLLAILILFVIGLSVGLNASGMLSTSPYGYIALAIIDLVLIGFGIWLYLRARKTRTSGTVARIVGPIIVAPDGKYTTVLSVREHRFQVPWQVAHAVHSEATYAVYYAPHDDRLLSAEMLTTMEEAMPGLPQMPRDQQWADECIEQGHRCYDDGDYLQAIEFYRNGIAAYPERPYRSHNLAVGEMLGLLERWDEAIDAYLDVVDAYPDHDEAWQRLAICYIVVGNETRALEAAERAIALNPKDDRSLYNAAMLYASRGNHRQARIYLERAVALVPEWRNTAAENPLLASFVQND